MSNRISGLSKRSLNNPLNAGVLKYVGGTSRHSAFVLDSEWILSRVDSKTGDVTRLIALSDDQRSENFLYQLIPGLQDKYLALSYRDTKNCSTNRGFVLNLESMEVVLDLDLGSYRTGHTDFPLQFFMLDQRELVIHGTDWNRLDITDLQTGELLTNRNLEDIPEGEDDWDCFSEWNGHIVVSPNQARAACVGWVWHPIGVVHSWRLDNWLRDNPFEVDVSEEKVSHAAWDYEWDSTIRWVDNDRLAIWSGDDFEIDSKNPHLLIVNLVDSEQRVRIEGPENNFYIDSDIIVASYLSGVGLWSVSTGALLAKHMGDLLGYHAADNEWLTIDGEKWVYWSYSTKG